MKLKNLFHGLGEGQVMRDITSAALGEDRGGPLFNLFSYIFAPDFDKLFDACTDVDRELITYVRAMSTSLPPETVRKAYQDIADSRLNAHRLSLVNVIKRFQWSHRSFTKRFDPDLRVLVDDAQARITFRTDREVVRVDQPELLWDCNKVSVSEEEHRTTCRIHGKADGEKMGELFGKSLVAIHYDGVEVLWRDLDDFWPPSIDAFHLVENLRGNGVLNQNIESVLDVGAGTGFLGLWLARHNPSVKRLYLSEWLLTPLLFATCNAIELSQTLGDRRVECWPLLGIYTLWPNRHRVWRDTPVDLLVCNPPYLPLPGNATEQWLTEVVAGTELLQYLIKHGFSHAKEVYLAWSDLALPEARAAKKQAGVDWEQVGKESRVPFRIPKVLRDASCIEYLKSRGLEECDGYHKYYHIVRTYRLIRGNKRMEKRLAKPRQARLRKRLIRSVRQKE